MSILIGLALAGYSAVRRPSRDPTLATPCLKAGLINEGLGRKAIMPFNILLVGQEKELHSFQPAVEAGAKKAVGAFKVFSASKAHEAVSTLSSTGGKCDVALMSHHFTCPGKEPFSDALRKVLKDQYANTVVVCWGHPDKGGKQGTDFHHGLENLDPGSVASLLSRIKSGELVSSYGNKKATPAGARKSMDQEAGSRRPSMDYGSPYGSPGVDRGNSLRRASLEHDTSGSFAMTRHNSGRKSVDMMWDAEAGMSGFASKPSMTASASMRGIPALPSMMAMGSLPRSGSLSGMPPMMGSMNPMTPMMPMTSMGSLVRSGSLSVTGGMTPMTPMNGMMPMTPMNASMSPMVPNVGAMNPMAPTMAPVGMPGMMPVNGMAMPAPAPMVAITTSDATPADVTTLLANLGMNSSQVSNADLIRMLAEEVVRLRSAVAQKKARASLDMNNLGQSRLGAY